MMYLLKLGEMENELKIEKINGTDFYCYGSAI